MSHTLHWLRKAWTTAKGSIAFYPALIAVLFLALSGLMLEFDFSAGGKELKASYKWLRLRDASTARSIISTIASGLLSFTVFSFSMVMIMLTQAAGQLSNRILSNLIGKPFQQVVLGCYIGTIIYALFLLTAIRNIDSGIYIPALSIYLLILFTVTDIFLFISFLHFVTQSVRYETVVGNILHDTEAALQAMPPAAGQPAAPELTEKATIVAAPKSNYFQGFNRTDLVATATRAEVCIRFLHPVGTYLLAGTPLLDVQGAAALTKAEEVGVLAAVDFFTGQTISENYSYGFRHLTEVALRALSPGINDPSTAVLALHALGRLLVLRMERPPATRFSDAEGRVRLITEEPAVEKLVEDYLCPLWDYGKEDRYLQEALRELLPQLIAAADGRDGTAALRKLLGVVEAAKTP